MINRMTKKIYLLLFILLLINLSYSFYQHYHMQLDGDMAGIILPRNDMQKIMTDPFGFKVILKNESYPNPNRFFVHFFMSEYFKLTPHLLQKFVNPINSVYLSCALIKLIIQISILLFLSIYIKLFFKSGKYKIIFAIFLIFPIFQTEGYNKYMGIIDSSITYTLNYALPLCLLLLFFIPFYKNFYINNKYEFSLFLTIILILFALVILFTGPLVPGIIFIISTIYFIVKLHMNFKNEKHLSFAKRLYLSLTKIPKIFIFFYLLLFFLSSYSVYIGMHNSFNISTFPLLDRYLRIPLGIYYLLFQKLGYPLFLILIGINAIIIKKKFYNEDGRRILKLFKWIGIFSVIYILLLPLGGYRDYRPNIIRYDTIMPVTLCLIIIYGISTYFLINTIKKKKYIYISAIVLFLMIFINANKSNFNDNQCEIQALEKISKSPDKIVRVDCNCTIMGWKKTTDYKDSDLNAELLFYWNITKKKKLYYQL